MKLEEGKRYVLRNAIIVGPIRKWKDPQFPFVWDSPTTGRYSWNEGGHYFTERAGHPLDIVAEYHEPEAPVEEDILHEAYRLTAGDRQDQYGAPDEDFTRIAKMWSALKGVEFSAREVAMFQICVKLSREVHRPKRDSAVDIAGYARCMHLCNEAAAKREGR